MRIETGARTDVGRLRKNNEDSYRVESSLNLFVLSDGMGGEAHGEVASQIAVETIVAHCVEAQNRSTPFLGSRHPEVSERTNRLASAIHAANQDIFEQASTQEENRGMGATVVAAWVEDSRLSLAHVGDSRAYLLRAGSLSQLTADHSLVAEKVRIGVLTPQEAEASELQNVLTRAVGTQEVVEVDAGEQALAPGDTLLLCSDGLTRMVTDPEIASTLLNADSAQAAADRLIELANEYGGIDNVTVIVAQVSAKPAGGVLDKLKSWTRGKEVDSEAR